MERSKNRKAGDFKLLGNILDYALFCQADSLQLEKLPDGRLSVRYLAYPKLNQTLYLPAEQADAAVLALHAAFLGGVS